MIRKVATIRIHNLRLRTLIGFNPEERLKKQDIVINAEIAYTLADGVFEDRVEEGNTQIEKINYNDLFDDYSLRF